MSATLSTSTVASVLPGGDPFAERKASGSQTDVATKEMFLKLLVAQIKNQNPLNPTDGVEYVTQLAQFTQLEQSIGMAAHIEKMAGDLQTIASVADGSYFKDETV